MRENEIAAIVVDTALEIHRELGPGLLESAYDSVLAWELRARGLVVEKQVAIPLLWRGRIVKEVYRADMIVERKVLIELKSVERTAPVHRKQVITYLRLSKLKLGLLVNFGEHLLKNGIHRIVNHLDE